MNGSIAQGCFIELSFPNGTLYALANASRNEGQKVILTMLPAYCYNISVYDWEEDGSMGDLPIPVSQAVWNDSCSTPTAPPSSASGMHFNKLLLAQLLSGWLTTLDYSVSYHDRQQHKVIYFLLF